MKNYVINILSLIVIMISISCKTTIIEPSEPVLGNLPEKPQRLDSQISLPLEINISEIQDYINQNLPKGQIASGSGKSGNTTKYNYQVFRNKPVSFVAHGDELVFRIPIEIKARGSYTACAGFWRDGDCCSAPNPFGSGCSVTGVRQTEHGDASPTIIVELRVKLNINEEYIVKAETYLKGEVTGDTHLHIDLIGKLIRINIDIKDKLEVPLQDFIQKYSKEINNKVSEIVENYDLKEKVEDFWKSVKTPVALDDFWLSSKPQKVVFENLNTQNGKLRIGVGFVSKLEIVDKKPIVYNSPLPNLELIDSTDGKFNIYLPAYSSFSTLNNLVKKEVVGVQYKKDGVKLEIKDIEIKGVGLKNVGGILVKVEIKGRSTFTKRFKGNLYFTAIPSIDDVKKELSVSEFKLSANTNSFLINNGLPYLVDNYFYDEIKQNLKFSYKEGQMKFENLINNELKDLVIDNIVVQGKLENTNVPGIYIDEQGMEVLLIAKGQLKSKINTGRMVVTAFKD